MLFNFVTIAFLSSFVSAETVADGSLFSRYGIDAMQWKFPTHDGGNAYVNGTAQEALVELMKFYPDALAFKSEASESTSLLGKRADFKKRKFNCNWGEYGDCFKIGVIDGIQYLRSLNGKPTNGPGPGNCARVSCSYGNSIWWCNDDRVSKTLEGWGLIADGAEFLVNHCAEGGKGMAYVHGQVFHVANWNVIVRHDRC